MAGFLYYISGISTVNRKKMIEYGLAHALEEAGEPLFASISPGPDKGAGVVFSVGSSKGAQATPNMASSFTWTKSPDAEHWIGYDKNSPPCPKDLERKEVIEGYQIKLADGNKWHIPIARKIDGDTSFPRILKQTKEGWEPQAVISKYRSLFDEACRVWDQYANTMDNLDVGDESDEPLTITVVCDLSVKALSCNYRISPFEVSVLELLDTQIEGKVLKAVIDIFTIEEYVKKNGESD